MQLDHSKTSEQVRRILAVVRHPVGGVRTHILYTYPILMQAGYRFTFVIPEGENHTPFHASVESWDECEIVEASYAGGKHGEPMFRTTVRRLLRERRFSLVHSHGMQAGISTIIANLGIGLPHAVTLHDVIVPQNDVPGRLKWLKRRMAGLLLSRANVLIPVSHDCKENHLQHFPDWKRGHCRVEVISNGIDLKRYPLQHGTDEGYHAFRDAMSAASSEKMGPPPSFRQELGIGPDTFLLGFLGRFMEQKGFLYLIKALNRLLEDGAMVRPVHVVAVGSGDCLVNYRWELDRYPRVKQYIRFLEHVSNVAPILRELDLLVMPSLWEACPILPMEAMCMGVPVLGTDCVGLREVLRDTPSAMVPASDAEAFASGLDLAIRCPWTEAARCFVPEARRRFDVASAAAKLGDVFDELIG